LGLRAAQTARLLEAVLELPSEEYGRVVSSSLNLIDDRAELIPILWSSFIGLLGNWLRWEDECRESRRPCSVDLPEEAREAGVAAYYSTSLKQLLVTASEELAVDWMLPHWLLWFSSRTGRPLAPRLRSLDVEEQLARLVLFPVYVRGLRGGVRALAEYYGYGGSEYAHTTALFVYWDVVMTLSEAVDAAIGPLSKMFEKPLIDVEKGMYIYVRAGAARAKRREVSPADIARRGVDELKNRLGRLLVEKRMMLENI
jgi:hypothetical protein